jgi:hypothetical protein
MTIYYAAPDLARPSGGVRTIYRHVDVLNGLGLAAAVVHARRGFRCTWFDNDTRVVHPPLELSPADVLVVPEQYVTRIDALAPGVRKVIFNQNAYRTFQYGAQAAVRAYNATPDVVGAMVVSEDSERYLRHCFPGLHVARVHHSLDPSVFRPDPGARTRLVSAVPTKRPRDLRQLLDVLGVRRALDGWRFVAIQGMTETQVASTLRASALFVSLNDAEGFGLPPAEAIACGCHVVGFHGMGAREFFQEPYATAIEDGDVIALASAVESFVTSYPAREAEADRLGVEGAAWITSCYSRAAQAADLTKFFENLVDGTTRPATLHTRDLPRRSRLPEPARRALSAARRRVARHPA